MPVRIWSVSGLGVTHCCSTVAAGKLCLKSVWFVNIFYFGVWTSDYIHLCGGIVTQRIRSIITWSNQTTCNLKKKLAPNRCYLLLYFFVANNIDPAFGAWICTNSILFNVNFNCNIMPHCRHYKIIYYIRL